MKRTAVVFVGFLVVLGMVGASAIAFAGGKPPKPPQQGGTEYWIAYGDQPRIYENTVFWFVPSSARIWMWDLGEDGIPGTPDDGEQQVVASGLSTDFREYHVWGSSVVFDDWYYPAESSQIYMIDLPTGAPYPVTEGAYIKLYPEIHESIIVYDNHPPDFSSGHSCIHDPGPDGKFGTDDDNIYEREGLNPCIWGNYVVCLSDGDLIVYDLDENGVPNGGTSLGKQHVTWGAEIYENSVVFTDDRGGTRDIYMHDLTTGEETPIATESKLAEHGGHLCSGSTIVYAGITLKGKTAQDVYAHDLSTGETHKLTQGGNALWWDVWGNHVVYQQKRDGMWSIYLYILDSGGGGQSAGVGTAPQTLSLSQASPNPCRNTTTLHYSVPWAVGGQQTAVALSIYDVTGSLVATLVDGKVAAGSHQVIWETDNTPSGIYFYRLTAGESMATRKLVILK